MIDINEKHYIWFPVGATVSDRAITLQHFQYEANPLVNALGPLLWSILSACLIVSLVGVWYTWDLHEYILPRVLIASLTVFTSVVFAGNVYVVLTA